LDLEFGFGVGVWIRSWSLDLEFGFGFGVWIWSLEYNLVKSSKPKLFAEIFKS